MKLAQQTDTVSVTIIAAVSAAFSVAFTPVNAILALVLIGLVILDVIVGTSAAYLAASSGQDWFCWNKFSKGCVKKLILVCLILSAYLTDTAFSGIFGSEIFEQYTPATKYALAHAIFAQLVSISKNANVVRELRPLAAFIIRRMDAAKLGYEPPERRTGYDNEAVKMEKKLETKDGRHFYDVVHEKDKEI